VNTLSNDFGVETGNVFYPPCHLQLLYKEGDLAIARSSLSVSEKVLAKTITLPMHAAMSEEDAECVVDSVNSSGKRG
jgi:dTDP-4-amino-4,6-dideoxygalactose transaminase